MKGLSLSLPLQGTEIPGVPLPLDLLVLSPMVSGGWVTGWEEGGCHLLGASCQGLEKLQEKKYQSEKKAQPPPESQQQPRPSAAAQSQSPSAPQPSQAQAPPQPRQQNAQDPLTHYTSKHDLQDPQKPGPQLGSGGTPQTRGQPNYFKDKFQGGQKMPQDPGKWEASPPCLMVQTPHLLPHSL